MSHFKIQRPTSHTFIVMDVVVSFILVTLLSCGKNTAIKEIKKHADKSHNYASINDTNMPSKQTTEYDEQTTEPSKQTTEYDEQTTESSKQATEYDGQTTESNTSVWACASCGYHSTKLGNICEGCGLSTPYIHDKVTKNKKEDISEPNKAAPNSNEDTQNNHTTQQDEVGEVCPVCLEAEPLTQNSTYACVQCKKLICVDCYTTMRKSDLHFCPLCRCPNSPTLQRSKFPKRKRTYTEPIRRIINK